MKPTFIFFNTEFPSYSVSAIAGAVVALIFMSLAAENKKRVSDAIYVFAFGLIGAIIGAKLLYWLTVLPQMTADIRAGMSLVAFMETYIAAGLVFYGGLFGGLAAASAEAKYLGFDARELFRLLIPAMCIFAGFGRIGCFLTGCCYGCECSGPLCIAFSSSPVAPNGVTLVPVQLIESGFDFILAVLFYHSSRVTRENCMSLYLLFYAVFRFFLEFFRGDPQRGIWFGLSTSQWISLVVIMVVACRHLGVSQSCE